MVQTISAAQITEIFNKAERHWEDVSDRDSCDEDDDADDDTECPQYPEEGYGYVEDATKLSDLSSSVRSLSFPEVSGNEISVTDLIGRVPSDVEVLYLGHDGVIYVSSTKDEDGYIIGHKRDSDQAVAAFTALIAGLPKLKKIHHCGYYSQYSSTDIKQAAVACGRSLKVCKIY